MPAFSDRKVIRYQFTTVENRIATVVYLYPSVLPSARPMPTKAIWDTGAQKSIITPYIAQSLNLKPINQIVIGGVHGKNRSDIVIVTLEIPGQNTHKNLQVAVCPFNPDPKSDANMLIGMDIISQGDFVLSNGNGYTLFSFATPPSFDKIDLSEWGS
jgi:hypothetical protein